MEAQIIKIIGKVLKFKKKINLKDSPKTINSWDSLAHLEMISELNQKLKINISFQDTLKIKKVGDVVKVCQKYKKK
tara:strand:+ start:354 stop:581 length:228 start_codon:yes stop_codon:yes gene_type:complete